jgi:hypothetical protein
LSDLTSGSGKEGEAAPTTLTRKDLIFALREQGCSITEARGIIDAMLGSVVHAVRRGEQVHTPIGRFHRDRKGSQCVTDSLEGGKRLRRLVRRKRAIHFREYPYDNFELMMEQVDVGLARGEGRIWRIKQYSDRLKDESRVVFSGTETKSAGTLPETICGYASGLG